MSDVPSQTATPPPHEVISQQLAEIQAKLAALPAPGSIPVVPNGPRSFWERVKSMRWLLGGIALILLGPVLTWFTFLYPQAGQSVFVLSPVEVTGLTALCPGETLDFNFNVTVLEVGTYNLWMSTWKTEPPPSTIIFSEIQPFVIGSVRSFPIVRKWKVPETYVDPADSADKPMISGEYIRDISVTAEGRNTSNEPLQIPFTIRKDCQVRSLGPKAQNGGQYGLVGHWSICNGDSARLDHLSLYLGQEASHFGKCDNGCCRISRFGS